MNIKWTEKRNHHEAKISNIRVMVHRRITEPDKWFLSLDESVFDFTNYPLAEFQLEDAKEQSIKIINAKANEIQNILHNIVRCDSKVIQSFKLKLVSILNCVENIQNRQDFDDLTLDIHVERLHDTVKMAISDLD